MVETKNLRVLRDLSSQFLTFIIDDTELYVYLLEVELIPRESLSTGISQKQQNSIFSQRGINRDIETTVQGSRATACHARSRKPIYEFMNTLNHVSLVDLIALVNDKTYWKSLETFIPSHLRGVTMYTM